MHIADMKHALWLTALTCGLALPLPGIMTDAHAEVDVWDGTLRRPVQGKGTKENPYLITNSEEFAYLMQNYDNNSGVCFHKYYRLTTDLDLGHFVWRYSSATTDNRTFIAQFDGAGHKIYNLDMYVYHDPSEVHAALFPQLGGDPEFESVIENLEVEDITLHFFESMPTVTPSHAFRVAGLVGQMYSNSRVENCIVGNMRNRQLKQSIELPENASYWVAPLVADVQEQFGAKGSTDVASARIINSYGYFDAKLDELHASSDQSVKVVTEQGKPGKDQNGYKWHQIYPNVYSFTENSVHITAEGVSPSGMRKFRANPSIKGNFTYRWTFNGEELPFNGPDCEIPFIAANHTLSVELLNAKNEIVTSQGDMIKAPDMELHTTSITSVGGGKSFNIKTDVRGENISSLLKDLSYQWIDLTDDEKVVGTSSNLIGAKADHTYLCVAQMSKNATFAISALCKVGKPIYVNLNGITSEKDIARYTFDGTTAYPAGDDSNDGSSPEKAVRTLQRAIDLLPAPEQGGSLASNVIVIMGDYTDNVFPSYLDQLATQPNPQALDYQGKQMLITGSYGNIHNGSILASGESICFDSDIRFENLRFNGHVGHTDACVFYAQDHNLTFGYGITMERYASMLDSRGLTRGAHAPMVTVVGGFLNPDQPDFIYQPNTIRILSGYFGRVIAGSRYTHNCYNSGNVTGSPRHPYNTSIIVDVHNPMNKYNNPFDIGLILGGQTDGSCYAFSDIKVKGASRVGRIVGGSIGYGRASFVRDRKGKLSPRPSDSFFGKTVINIESGTINEIYGTSLGGNDYADNTTSTTFVDSCTTYFYGISEINISGGEIQNTIYGAGAGSVTGMMLNDRFHTFDPLIPHALSNGQIAYGPWEEANGNIPNIIAPDGSTLHIYDAQISINISGTAQLWGSVYGGGYGHSSTLRTHAATMQSGNLYGDTHINITGGHVSGYVHGGGRSSLTYYDNHDLSGYPVVNGKQQTASYFNAIAQTYGDTHVHISGGVVEGMIFGGGEGAYYRAVSPTDSRNDAGLVAAVFGNTHVTIDSIADVRDHVFGAGNYGDVITTKDPKRPSGNTYVTINGGRIGNTIFGGGHGHYDAVHNQEQSVTADVSGDTHIIVNGGEFAYVGHSSRYSDTRYFNILGSGRTSSIVHGDTYIEMHHSLLGQAMLDSIGMHTWADGKPWEKRYCVAGGGFGDATDVLGNTHILIDIDGNDAQLQKHHQAICKQTMSDFVNLPGATFTDILGGGLKGHVHGSTEISVKGMPIIRNIYGGSLQGDCGLRDKALNGTDCYEHSTAQRAYTTRTVTNIYSGRIQRIYGGSLMGDICGETEVNIGVAGDTAANRLICIDDVYGGNDLTGTIAGANNELYGTHVNVCGGTILGSLFGSGDGTDISQQHFAQIAGKQADGKPYMRERPHVASVMINIKGDAEGCETNISKVFVGGNNTTVGLFDRDELDQNNYGIQREVLRPNTGRAAINIASHVTIGELYMGCHGGNLLKTMPNVTYDGQHWNQGFINETDFNHFCRYADMSCVPTLTFNADGQFHNNHPIDDRMGDILEFNTYDEMNAVNVTLNEFCGGGYRGSMTSDSCYIYTLPTGVTVNKQVVGGSHNAYYQHTAKRGPDSGKQYLRVGGIAPYRNDFIRTDRVQLNLFNHFADVEFTLDRNGNPSHRGAKVFGGCLDYGIIMGYVSLNYHSDILGGYDLRPGETWESISREWNSDLGYIYAAGKGKNTEILGATYINIRGAVFNGEKCIPNCLNVFGGGMAGRVIGRTNVSVDIQCKGSSAKEAQSHAVWGKVYGGGRMGDVCMQSTLVPAYRSPRTAETHVRVYSGYVGEVFGGARMANIENGTWVEINDRSTEHFHTMIGRVFGGSDLSGHIGSSPQISKIRKDTIRTNTYVSITEMQHADGTYSGFPLIGALYGGGNGEYGTQGGNERYSGGEILSREGIIQLAGMELPNIDSTWIEITGGTLMEAYGGANSSNVRKLSHIAIDYAENTDVKAHFDRTASEQCYKRGKAFISEPFIKNAFNDDGVMIGLVHNICRLYGGNNSAPLLIQPEWDLQHADIGTIYGGCNQGDVLYYNEAGDRNVNPGSQEDPALWLVLCNDELHIDNVFGGSRMGNIRPSRITFDEKTQRGDTIPVTFGENQYGSKILVSNGTYGRIFGGNDVSGNVLNGTHIMLNGGEVGEVYGAGNGFYTYKWDPAVSRVTEVWDTELQDYVYHIPATSQFGGKAATDIQKIEAINACRPHVTKSFVEVNGTPGNVAVVTDGVYSGGHCSTVLGDDSFIKMDLGDYAIINNVYLGSNAEEYVGKYANHLLSYNGITNYDQRDAQGRSLLDVFMEPVAIYSLPRDFHFRSQYNYGYIGSFFLGGRRGSLIANGQLDINFPRTLQLFDKIVGGPDRAEVQFVDPAGHRLTYQGGVRWNKQGEMPKINIDVQCDFINAKFNNIDVNRYEPDTYLKKLDEGDAPAVRVYSGCYQSGQVEGSVNIEMNGIGEEEEIFF